MNDHRIDVSPRDMQTYLDRANELRAEAIRASFVEFKDAVKSAFGRVVHMLHIPRTEQL